MSTTHQEAPAPPPPPLGERRGTATGAHRRPRRPVARRFSALDVKFSPYLYILPFFLVFLAFGLYPLGYMFWVSLHDWDLLGGHKWVGLGNYSTLMSDADFWNATRNTLGLFVVTAVPQLLLALGMAHALNRRLRSRTLFRMGVLLPNITSVTAVALIFLQLFGRDYGLVNWLFSHVGMHKVDWQVGRWPSWTAITVMVDWRWTGYNALIFLGAMQAIPRDLYEAAAIDGANQWRQFRKITVPLLRPAITFAVIISTIGSIQLFTEPFIFDNTQNANGGSAREFQTLAMYMYQNGILRFKAGYGAAIAWMMFLLVLVIAAINFLLIRRTQRRG